MDEQLMGAHRELMVAHRELMTTHGDTIKCIKDHLQPSMERAIDRIKEHSKSIECLSKAFKEYEPFLKPAKERAEWRKHSSRTAVVTFCVTASIAVMGYITAMLWVGFRVYVLGPVPG